MKIFAIPLLCAMLSLSATPQENKPVSKQEGAFTLILEDSMGLFYSSIYALETSTDGEDSFVLITLNDGTTWKYRPALSSSYTLDHLKTILRPHAKVQIRTHYNSPGYLLSVGDSLLAVQMTPNTLQKLPVLREIQEISPTAEHPKKKMYLITLTNEARFLLTSSHPHIDQFINLWNLGDSILITKGDPSTCVLINTQGWKRLPGQELPYDVRSLSHEWGYVSRTFN